MAMFCLFLHETVCKYCGISSFLVIGATLPQTETGIVCFGSRCRGHFPKLVLSLGGSLASSLFFGHSQPRVPYKGVPYKKTCIVSLALQSQNTD